MTIKQIVMAGGGYLGLYQLGILSRLLNTGYLHRSNIHSIYGTSIGAFFGAVFCLNEDWKVTIEYFVERPWYKIFTVSPNILFNAVSKKGVYNKDTFDKLLLPLIKSRNYNETMTLGDLYTISNITLYMYTIELNTFTLEEISHKTHSDMPLLEALYMTCALPFLFQPLVKDDKCYVDGGLLNTYPLQNCIDRLEDKEQMQEILGIRFKSERKIKQITDDNNIFEYGYFLYRSLIQNIRPKQYPEIENEIVVPCVQMNMDDGSNAVQSRENREEYITSGQDIANRFLGTITRL